MTRNYKASKFAIMIHKSFGGLEMHKKVQVVIFCETEESTQLLTLQTNERRGSFWQNVTGSVDGLETFKDAAKRELQEETSLEIIDIRDLKLSFEFSDQWNRQVIEKCFLAIVKKSHVKIDSNEHQQYSWININHISDKNFKFQSNYKAFLEAKESYLNA